MADGASPDSAAPATALLGQDSGIFVSPAATGAFGGVVESHNVLAQKLCDFQQQLEALKQSHEEATRAAKEQVAKDEERRAAEATKAEEDKKKLDEQLEAFKALIEERSASIQEKSNEAIKGLDDSVETRFKALNHSLEEISQHQADLVSRTLPKWEADISLQVKKVSDELSSLSASCDSRFKQLEGSLEKQHAELNAERQDLELRLSNAISAAEGRLDAAEASLQKLAQDLVVQGNSSSNRDAELTAQLSAAEERLEAFAKSQAQAVLVQFGEDAGARLGILESVVKQADFERLNFTDRATKELAAIRRDLEALDKDCSVRVGGESATLREEAAKTAKEQQAQLAQALAPLHENIKACEKRDAELANGLSSMEGRLRAEDSVLRERIEAESRRLEQCGKTEAAGMLATIRADEGRRLEAVEGQLKEAELQRRQLGARISQEEEERKSDVQNSAAAAEKRVTAVELVANARFESVRQAVDELASEFQGYVIAETGKAMDTSRLETLVRALEVRVWPWRHHAKDRPEGRSPSPQPTWSTSVPTHGTATMKEEYTAAPTSPDWQSWLKSPKKPAGSRPGSATWRSVRGGGSAGTREEKDMSGSGLQGSPVGPGLVAARATRSPQLAPTPTSAPEPVE